MKNSSNSRMNFQKKKRRGFVLLEALLAVAIFALGIIALGRCVSNCVAAERLKSEDSLARRALENRTAEILSGAVPLANGHVEKLTSTFAGMSLKQTREDLKRKNENDQDLTGLSTVTLEVSWSSSGETHSRTTSFFANARTP